MNYESVRDQILDGDLVAVRARGGVMNWLIRHVTGSPYTHTGIALWLDPGRSRADVNSRALAIAAAVNNLVIAR